MLKDIDKLLNILGVRCRLTRPIENVFIFSEISGTSTNYQALLDRVFSFLKVDRFITYKSEESITVILLNPKKY